MRSSWPGGRSALRGHGRAGLALVAALSAVLLAAAAAHGRGGASTVTVTVTTTGAGAVDASTEKSHCRDSCKVTLLAGQRLTLKARPDAGNRLDAWSGACIGAALECELVVNEALAVRAAFAP